MSLTNDQIDAAISALEDLKAARCTPEGNAVVEPWRGPDGLGNCHAVIRVSANPMRLLVGAAGVDEGFCKCASYTPAQIYEMCHALLERAMIVEGVSSTAFVGVHMPTRELQLRSALFSLSDIIEEKS